MTERIQPPKGLTPEEAEKILEVRGLSGACRLQYLILESLQPDGKRCDPTEELRRRVSCWEEVPAAMETVLEDLKRWAAEKKKGNLEKNTIRDTFLSASAVELEKGIEAKLKDYAANLPERTIREVQEAGEALGYLCMTGKSSKNPHELSTRQARAFLEAFQRIPPKGTAKDLRAFKVRLAMELAGKEKTSSPLLLDILFGAGAISGTGFQPVEGSPDPDISGEKSRRTYLIFLQFLKAFTAYHRLYGREEE